MDCCLPVCWLEWNPNQQTAPPPIKNNKYQYRIDTLSSPDDGHIDAQNKQRREKIYAKNYVHLTYLFTYSMEQGPSWEAS